MVELGIAIMLITTSAVTMIIALFVLIDMRKEKKERPKRYRRNFGFPGKNIEIDRKDRE